MMDVTVKVPEDRLAEFYRLHAAWLSAPPQTSDLSDTFAAERNAMPQVVSRVSEDADDREPWQDTDAALAAKLWGKFSDPAKALFSTLIDEPDRRFNGVQLADMLNIPHGQSGVAGVLAWPGKYCKQANRELLWEWTYPAEGEPCVYWLEPPVAAMLREARDRRS